MTATFQTLPAGGGAGAPGPGQGALTLFRPHLFFNRPWEGWGEMFSARGQRVAGFTVCGAGRAKAREGEIVQNWAFDNGYTHKTAWRILSTRGSDYRAVDAETGAVALGRQIGEAFLWELKVPGRSHLGLRTMKVSTVYRMISPTEVQAVTTTTALFGLIHIGRMEATYRRLAA